MQLPVKSSGEEPVLPETKQKGGSSHAEKSCAETRPGRLRGASALGEGCTRLCSQPFAIQKGGISEDKHLDHNFLTTSGLPPGSPTG